MSTEPKDATPKARDDAEPTSGSAPAPIALIFLFAMLVYWGMLYLDDHGGGFNPKVYQPYASYAIVADHQPITDPVTAAMNEGGKLFNLKCAICHQNNGSGGTCPPLAGSDWAAGGGPNRIIRLVMNGGAGPITVSGKQITPQGSMLSFKDDHDLGDKQIAAVLSYVRNSWGNKASLVTPEQVAKIRDVTSSRRLPWTAPELLAIPDKDPVQK